MKVSPAPTVSTTFVGKPGTRVMMPPGSTATPPPGPSVITASPRPYCSTQRRGDLDRVASSTARCVGLGQEPDVLVTGLDDALSLADGPQPGLHLRPVLVRVGDHRRPHVDVVGHPGAARPRIQSSSTSAPGLTTHDKEAMCSQSSLRRAAAGRRSASRSWRCRRSGTCSSPLPRRPG